MPRPEFGKPETGQARYWFRTDAQMRRAFMSAEEREIERQRISVRRAQMKKAREEAKEFERRRNHAHFLCDECAGGLHDIGAIDGKGKERTREPGEQLVCCVCLSSVHLGPKRVTVRAKRGPNWKLFRCRIEDPDRDEALVS